MSNIPIEKQLLPVNPLERIEHKIAQGEAISGGELLERSSSRKATYWMTERVTWFVGFQFPP
jgi:hypothetical protein